MTGEGIAIEEVEPGEGQVIAKFTARMGGVRVRGLRLVNAQNGGVFVGMPSRRLPNSDEWVDMVELSDPLKERVRDAAKAAIQPD